MLKKLTIALVLLVSGVYGVESTETVAQQYSNAPYYGQLDVVTSILDSESKKNLLNEYCIIQSFSDAAYFGRTAILQKMLTSKIVDRVNKDIFKKSFNQAFKAVIDRLDCSEESCRVAGVSPKDYSEIAELFVQSEYGNLIDVEDALKINALTKVFKMFLERDKFAPIANSSEKTSYYDCVELMSEQYHDGVALTLEQYIDDKITVNNAVLRSLFPNPQDLELNKKYHDAFSEGVKKVGSGPIGITKECMYGPIHQSMMLRNPNNQELFNRFYKKLYGDAFKDQKQMDGGHKGSNPNR